MFGYILANRDALTEEQQGRYRALYCALCRTLGKEYGTLAKLSLSYDMVMLILMLNGMYEPGEEGESFVCPVHPFKKRQGIKTEYTGYAADMTVVLAYEKMLDDCADENSPISHAGERALRAAYAKAAERQKDKAQEIAARLRELYAAERQQRGIDDLANLFGGVLGEVFDYGDSLWRGSLREFGEALGRFIYVLDAYADFEKDKKKGRFNPLESNADESILSVLMGEVSQIFERLPILQDAEIIRNIIYSGVWIRYRARTKKKGEAAK